MSSSAGLAVGTFVEHPKKPDWGLGRIIGRSDDSVVVVFKNDPDRGFRRLILSYLTLTIRTVTSDIVLDRLPPLQYFEQGWKLGMPNYASLWKAIAHEFGILTAGRFRSDPSDSPFSSFMQLHLPAFGTGDIHYEWLLRPADEQLDVALHVELRDQAKSLKWLEPMLAQTATIGEGVEYRLVSGAFGGLSGQMTFVIPYKFEAGTENHIAPVAAGVMNMLIERTIDLRTEQTR